jgi:hypothetical protein
MRGRSWRWASWAEGLSGSMILIPLLQEVTFQVTIPSVELAGQCDKASIFLTMQDYLLWLLTVIRALHEGQPPWLIIQ